MAKFKVGDKVKIVNSRIKSSILDVGKIVTITGLRNDLVGVIDEDVYRVDGSKYNWYEDELELVKPKFDIKDYPGKYVMHVKSKEDDATFRKYMDSIGERWSSGDKYINLSYFDDHTESLIYFFNPKNTFSRMINWYKDIYTYLNFEDFDWSDFEMNKQFTKKDLKNGDVVLRRNGNVDVVILDMGCLLNQHHGGFYLSNINDDLTSVVSDDWDIIAVRRLTSPVGIDFRVFEYDRGTLVYERKEVEEMTLEEVCKALGKEVKIVKEHK